MPTTFIALSGPSHTGKTTLMSFLSERLRDHSSIVFERDVHDVVWNSLCATGIFKDFYEITDDRDYLYIYISRMIEHYKSLFSKYENHGGIVFLDGSHLDLLIYSMLNLWYHYPTKELQEVEMSKLLSLRDNVSLIYMTVADDESYPASSKSARVRNTTFKRNRALELTYYDIFREASRVVSIPTTSLGESEIFIVEDMKKRGLV